MTKGWCIFFFFLGGGIDLDHWLAKRDSFMIGKGDIILDFRGPKVDISEMKIEIFAMVFTLPATFSFSPRALLPSPF